jgi:isoquinoline 1-oxidoreductase beta subunit
VSARKQAVRLNRREFLIAGTGVAGSLVLGLPRMTAADGDERMLGFFVQINADGSIVIGSNQPEIGQGVRTALPMLVAEELDVEWSTVSVRQMPLGIVKTADGYAWKYGGQGVGGSTGLTSNWDYMREVGATARRQLIRAAAKRLGVAEDQCSTRPGVVICAGQEVAYGELIAEAALLDLPAEPPPLKDIDDYRIVGSQQRTVDAHEIVTGKTKYGVDTAEADMRYAVIARAPVLNARVKSFDDTAAREIAGVLDVFTVEGPEMGEPYVILASGVAVVATSTWAAMKGRNQMLHSEGQVVLDDGDYDGAIAAAERVVTRQYRVPFVSHAPLEPQNCYAHVQEDRCHIIVPTQFGRRLTNDYVAEAAMISKKTGWPIKLQWTREDDMRNDFYRPGGLHEMRAGLNGDGRVTAWTQRLASGSKYYRRPNMPDEDLWKAELYPDDFPRRLVANMRLEYFHNAIGLPRGSWRAPAHNVNGFVVQSFLDELAHETDQDPLQFRLDVLGEARELEYGNHGGPTFNPGRLSRLLKFVAERIGYGKSLPKGRGIGIATHFTFGGYAAHAIEVTTALGLEITVRDGAVQQSNFDDYPLARISMVPAQFETHILPWDDVPTGVGEMGLPSAAPALTNAIFMATGRRIRTLPIGDQLKG